MKFILILCALFASGSLFAGSKAHVHGEGKLNLAIDGSLLEIEMEIPGESIVGFEHKPKTAAQKKAVRTQAAKFKKVEQIFGIPASAKCKMVSSKVESPLQDHEEGSHGGSHKEEHHEEETHSEFHVTYKFKCGNVKEIRQITLKLFQTFKKLHELNATAVTPWGAFKQERDAKDKIFKLTK